MNNKISNVVFTKNRPLQLHAYLESLRRFLPAKAIETYILYKPDLFSDEYETCFASFPGCRVICETNFHRDFMRLFESLSTEYILFGIDDLMAFFGNDPKVACVGSGKVEWTPVWEVWLKKLTDFKTFRRKLLRAPDPLGMHRYYNRTVCSIYRTNVLKKEQLSFLMVRDKGLTVGKKLYFELVDRGYKTVELTDGFMKQYLYHLAHATQVVNNGRFSLKKRTVNKVNRFINIMMQSRLVKEILADDSLDH